MSASVRNFFYFQVKVQMPGKVIERQPEGQPITSNGFYHCFWSFFRTSFWLLVQRDTICRGHQFHNLRGCYYYEKRIQNNKNTHGTKAYYTSIFDFLRTVYSKNRVIDPNTALKKSPSMKNIHHYDSFTLIVLL